jgi:predicted flap endonuclease-1-like 5' DNA nuclease
MNNFWCNFLPIIVGLGGAWIGGLIGWYMRRSRIAELESLVDDKESENLHLKNNNEMMGIRLENFQNEYTRASANLNVSEDKFKTLQNNYTVLETTNRVLSSQIEEVNAKLNNGDNTIEDSTSQLTLSEKENRIAELETQYAVLQTSHATILAEHEALKGNPTTIEQHMLIAPIALSGETDNKYAELEQAHALLLSEHEKRSSHIASVYASKEEWRQAFIELELKTDAYEQQLEEVKKLNGDLEQSYHDMSAKYHQLAEEVEALTEKNSHLTAEFTQLDSENVALVAKTKEEPTTQIVEVVDENMRQEMIYLQDAKAQLEITRIRLENDLEILRGRYEELLQQQNTSENSTPIESVDNARLEQLEAQNQELQQDLEKIKAEAAEREHQLAETHKISSNLWQKRYTNILNEIDEYKSQLTSLKTIKEQYDEKAKEWESMYDELVISYQESNEAYRTLMEKNSQHEEKIAELETNALAYTGTIAPEPEIIDDLKIVEGIGPKIEDVLKKAGILTFEQLSKTPSEQISEILEAAGSQFKMHDPTTWSAQAELAAKQEWEKLKAYQDYLLGGRDAGAN